MTCTACQSSGHPCAAHHSPALARMLAQLADANGDRETARMWRWVASSAERRGT